MQWFTATATFRGMQGAEGGDTGLDDSYARRWGPEIGVEIMGRNKFGPQRGAWPTTAGPDGGATSRRSTPRSWS